MSGKSPLTATQAQVVELKKLAKSHVRDEADRARGVLRTLDGWSGPEIAEAFGVTEDSVRHWRLWFAEGGVDALRAVLAPGPSSERGARAAAIAAELLAAPVQDRVNWTLPRLAEEIGLRGVKISPSRLSVVLKKNDFAWRRPRHTLIGRQDAEAVSRIGLRLTLLKQQAQAGDLVLLHADESEALTHPYLAHAWARKGADLRVAAPGQSRKVAMLGAIDVVSGDLVVHTSRTKKSADFVDLLKLLDALYGPKPGQMALRVVVVIDNGPIHSSKETRAALAARPWLEVEWMPKYAPELNEIERTWRDLKRHFLAHQTFKTVEELGVAIGRAVAKLNRERSKLNPCDKLRIAA